MIRHKAHLDPTLNLNWQSSLEVNTRVCIGKGVIKKLPDLLSQIHAGNKVLLITQPSCLGQEITDIEKDLRAAGKIPFKLQLPDGEDCKSTDWLIKIWDILHESQFSRQDTIVAMGGGTVTDVAGFAASTYLRGINLVSIPTTLLAQVDAAIGGKTGINFHHGKNMAGTFYFARAIIVDIDTLSTLPRDQFISGLAEVVKYGLLEKTIANESEYCSGPKLLIDILQQEIGELSWDNILLPGIIATCIKMKLSVVASDPLESNLRRCLNLGHTLGHALEAAGNFNLSHGQAVAIGMAFALHIAVSCSLIDPIEQAKALSLIKAAGLPITVPNEMQKEKLLDFLFLDKKREGEGIKMVIPHHSLGQVEYKKLIARAEIEKMLSAFC